MNTTVQINGRSVDIQLSPAASAALTARAQPLLAEMELYFSCLVRKKVNFRELVAGGGGVAALDGLNVSFRPVMTATCHVGDFEDEPPVTDFPIAKPEAFVPHWLRIDYLDGQWAGEFGYGH